MDARPRTGSGVRIAHVTALYAPEFQGGATLVCQRLAEELVALGHTSFVVSGRATAAEPTGAVRRERVGACPVWRVNVGGALHPWSPESHWSPDANAVFADFLAETRPDVVHVHSLQGIGAGILGVAADAGVPAVVTMHDWWWLCPCLFRLSPEGTICPARVRPESCSGHHEIDFAARRAILEAALASVARVVVPSRFLRDSLVANGLVRDAVVQENGLPPPAREVVRSSAGPVRFLYVGGAGNHAKGLAVLLEAVASLEAEAAELVLDCRAVSAEEAAPWAERLGKRLELHPPFPAAEIDDVVASADVVVIPSLMRESFSLVAREALARGCPVVTSDCGGPEEVVESGRNGLVFAAGSPEALAGALRRLARDRDLLQGLREGARRDPLRTITPREQALASEVMYREVVREAAKRESAKRESATRESATRSGAAARRRLGGLRVLFLSGIDGAPLRYRVWNLVERLALAGIASDVLFHSDVRAVRAARRADVIVLNRAPFGAVVATVVAEARLGRVPVVFSADDLVFRPDLLGEAPALEHADAQIAAGYRASVEAYARSCATADAFLGSTPELAEAARELGLPAFVVPNGLSSALLALSEAATRRERARCDRKQDARIRLGFFSGTDTHDADLALVAPALERVLDRFDHVSLVLGGPVEPGPRLEAGGRVERFARVAWSDLPARLAALDVNLAPLDTARPFNRAKSEVKLLEAAAVGVATVASDAPAFSRASREGATALLCDDARGWEESLRRLVESAPLREALGAAARRDVRARYDAAAQADDLVSVLAEIVDRAADRRNGSKGPLPAPLDLEAGEGSEVALEPPACPYDAYQLEAESGGPLRPGREIEQTFTCARDGLRRVDVLVGTYARRNDHDVLLSVHDAGGATLGARRVPAAHLLDRHFVSVELDEPLDDSAGRTVSVRARAPEAVPGNEILLLHGPSELGGLTIGGEAVAGRSLAFRTFAAPVGAP